MIIVPFENWHVRAMHLREYEQKIIAIHGHNLELFLNCYSTYGIGYTGIIDDKIIGSAGITELWPGVGEVWFFSSIYLNENKKTVYKTLKGMLKLIIDNCTYNRIQACVKSDFEEAVRLIERLEFEREGLMKKYGPEGADYYKYARIK